MVNAINRTQQKYITKPIIKQNTDVSEKQYNPQYKSDVYVASDVIAKNNQMEQTKETEKEMYYGLSEKEWEELASKYDVENLDKEQRKELLTELKDKGVINEQEYRITKFVFIPVEKCSVNRIVIGEDKKWNFDQKNWLEKYDAIAEYCDELLDNLQDVNRAQGIENIRDVYLKIADIFDKIAEQRKIVSHSDNKERIK
ncbi:hypothetical protein [Clostridium sp. MD294]|uniref:hypothetical protein n=1 Tax=Clostridium sp. MD294 TaxID=97138 RepID=UPI0002CAC4B2|nr:hypothetical protein [Clostridium sp. MD294]NDO47817.1 hypothetical protein [Clostridium sp. MD294]USF29863.1 hypothetical protein C820_001271 [Clostridium sp. MD294]